MSIRIFIMHITVYESVITYMEEHTRSIATVFLCTTLLSSQEKIICVCCDVTITVVLLHY